MKAEKKFNKILIGAILGTTILGVAGAAMTPKGKKVSKSIRGKTKEFFAKGLREMKNTAKGKKDGEEDSTE